jgi:dephospho-CoA kinase
MHQPVKPADKFLVVITGGISTGKSMVTSHLRQIGETVIDTDEIARRVVEPGSPVLTKITGEWGEDMLSPDGSLNRKKLGAIIFSSEKDRNKLNSIMHPAIRKIMYKEASECPNPIVFLDVPLFYEAKVPLPHDEVILVWCPRAVQKERLMKRDSISADDAEIRIKAQMDMEEKKKLCRIILDNSGSPETLAIGMEEILTKLKKKAAKTKS